MGYVSAMTCDSLGDRMKRHEEASRTVLPPRMPIILRVDGRAFHTLTKCLERPYDEDFAGAMNDVAVALCKDIQGAQLAYVQSDEISVLVHGYKKFTSEPWFGNQVQKMVSIAAARATATMTNIWALHWSDGQTPMFDARAFVLPEHEVVNYFIWRQQDATRNSIQMLARSLYSHKECNNKNCSQLQEMCFQKGKNWDKEPTWFKRGRCIVKIDHAHRGVSCGYTGGAWVTDLSTPIFSEKREYIEKLLEWGE